MNLKELVDTYSPEDAAKRVGELYESQVANYEGYVNVMNELRTIEPSQKYGEIVIELIGESEKAYISVSGWFPEDPEEWWAIELQPWEDWLPMEINLLEPMTELDALAHCLWEMTFNGYSNDEVKGVMAELNSRLDSIEDGTATFVPWNPDKCPDCDGLGPCPVCNP